MTLIFLVLCAVSAGYLGHRLAQVGLDHFAQLQLNARLKTSRTQETRKIPLASVLSWMDRWLVQWVQAPILKKYHDQIEDLIRRSRRTELKPSQVISYQCLASVGGLLFFYLLSDSGFLGFLAFGLGAFYPYLWLREKALARERKVLVELPNALEVLSLCSEAGLSLEQAMDQYIRNAGPGPMSAEIGDILEQTQAGSSRKKAMESVAKRLSVTDFSLFASSVIHAEKFGTGIAVTLRQLARTLRDKQSQRAEKAVQEMPVKLLFPLVLFIMPVTFLIIFGPILLQFMKP